MKPSKRDIGDPMNSIVDSNNPDLEAGGRINDYRIVRIESLKEISSIFYELKHPGTGAKHIHISNSDAEKHLWRCL